MRRVIETMMPERMSRSLRRATQAFRQHSYRGRRFLDLDTRSREWACREEFFYNAFKALTFNGISGDYCEFGSHGCVTFRLAYQQSRRHGRRTKLWAFDSFAGFPQAADGKDDHPKWRQGGMNFSLDQFRQTCDLAGIAESEYRVVPGYFEESLASLPPEEAPKDICLAYIDCDMFTSTMTVLDFLRPRLKHGMIIAFDDYYCWSATQPSGERQAMRQAFPADGPWELVPYLPYGWHGASFMLESKSLASVD
ncbi:MAG: TylF/MycF/NovP-related O-methyltransferase [Acidobacteriota bacterium]